jgi:hypothetical protein
MARIPIEEQRLRALEAEFQPLLVACLRQCADGRWGLFGRMESAELQRYYEWPEAARLKEMAAEIRELRAEFGQTNQLAERFLHYCSLRGPNDLGEPKLASAFLAEINSAPGQQS